MTDTFYYYFINIFNSLYYIIVQFIMEYTEATRQYLLYYEYITYYYYTILSRILHGFHSYIYIHSYNINIIFNSIYDRDNTTNLYGRLLVSI